MFHVLNIIIACVAHATRPVGHRPAHRVAFGMNVADVLLPCCSSHRTSGGPTNWYGSLFSYKPLSPNTYTICGTHSFNHSTSGPHHQAPKHGSRYRMDGSELHGPACANSPRPPPPPPPSPPPRPPPPPSPPYRLLCPSHRHLAAALADVNSVGRRAPREQRLYNVCVAHGSGVQQGSASEEAVVICLHSACRWCWLRLVWR